MKIPPDLLRTCLSMADPSPSRASVPPPLDCSEEELQSEVVQLAQNHLWRVFHQRPARTVKGWRSAVSGEGKGFTDLVLVKFSILFVELKTEKGTLSDDQKAWRDAILAAGGNWRLWRPRDWRDIVQELSR